MYRLSSKICGAPFISYFQPLSKEDEKDISATSDSHELSELSRHLDQNNIPPNPTEENNHIEETDFYPHSISRSVSQPEKKSDRLYDPKKVNVLYSLPTYFNVSLL